MKYTLYFLSLFILFASCNSDKFQVKPNVIIILTDDQGWGDLSVTGNTNLSTPNIDKLAEGGVMFENFYVCPVCSPTRAEMLTGRYHTRGGVYSTSAGGERLDLDETTIAEIFKNAGYSTAAYGKWHNGMQYPYHPNARGFDDFYGFCSGHWGNYFSPMLEHNGEIVEGNGFIIDDLTEHGIDFIEKNRDTPFFLYLPYNTPHSPMQIPDEWWNRFKDRSIELQHIDSTKEDQQFTKAALALCENIDWNVGRITAKIEERGLSENTIIIYFSDNGPNSWRWNGGMKGKKGSTDEGGVRSPFIIQWKGKIQSGESVEQTSGAIDLLPTLADFAGINLKIEKPLDGISLKPIVLGEEVQVDNRFLFSHWGSKTSVRSQQFRLDSKGLLFDMEKDLGQKTDVSELYPDIAKELLQAKANWESEVVSELPEKDTRTFPIGHPDFMYTQIPARDGIAYGNIKRSNRWPNCSFFTNWVSIEDEITWTTDVVADGDFELEIYYTCPENDIGSTFELSFGEQKIKGKIIESHDPPFIGVEYDRIPREESYAKDFKPLSFGSIHLKKGECMLTLKAIDIPGSQVMDFRLLMLKRID